MNKFFIFIFCLHLIVSKAFASHMIGGEVSYKCLTNDTLLFTITLYQDCISGITDIIENDNPAEYAIYENRPVPVFLFGGQVPSKSNRIIPPEFSNDCISNYPTVCLREDIYEFKRKLPPSPYGYTLVYQRCCRNATIVNIATPGIVGVTYYTIIPSFTSGECPNNSPKFNEPPPQIICSNFPFSYDFSVTDIDGDSIVYTLCTPFIGASLENEKPSGASISAPPFTPVSFIAPYNFNNPFPSFPNVSVNSETGILSGFPLTSGRYLVNVCALEYRDGELINTHSREVQFIITNCSKNVVANTPLYSNEPNTYIINCKDYTVLFENSSVGGHSYEWDFGDGSAPSYLFQPSHTYLDTGTFRVTLYVNKGTTCADSISRIVKIYPELSADFEITGVLCPGEEIQLIENISSSLDESFKFSWDFGDGRSSNESQPKIIYSSSGNYIIKLNVQTPLGCDITVTKSVTIKDFIPFAGNDTIIVKDYAFQLKASGGDNYEWFPKEYLSDPYVPDPYVYFPDTGMYNYQVTISTNEGCIGTDSINVLVVGAPTLFLPNAFSPNGDGLNDIIKPLLVGYKRANSFRIYNRYGELVYVNYSHHFAWDGTFNGKDCDIGVYFYELNILKIDDTDTIIKGDITLIR